MSLDDKILNHRNYGVKKIIEIIHYEVMPINA